MRLERLETTGFGRLGDIRVDFAPGVTVVVGPNECGKSTLHRAVRAALYGLDAGGQGRPSARSEWARWRPWEGRGYGVVLQYALSDGRRFRVARRLEDRQERVQVHEIGGGDVTDALRSGRLVVPGLHHLGIDEAVFCATACAGEDALDWGADDAPCQRVTSIQAAVERLADAAGRVTAGDAVRLLTAARDRIGTERRAGSALGRAVARLRALDDQIAAARARIDAIAGDRATLVDAEAAAAAAVTLAAQRRRAWLEGRLAQLGSHRGERAAALAEMARLDESMTAWAPRRSFPVEREDRVVTVGAELRPALEAETVARQRWTAAREEARAVERRRAEIGTALAALGSTPRIDEAARQELETLRGEVEGEAGVERRVDAVAAARAQLDGLRREVAATGLGSVPRGRVDEVADLLDRARERSGSRALGGLAGGALAVGMVAALALAGSHHVGLGGVAGGLLLVLAGALALAHRRAGGAGAAARRELGRLCPGLDTGAEGVERAAQRLALLGPLHDALTRQEGIVAAGTAELDETSARLSRLADRCLRLAARIPVDLAPSSVPIAGPVGHLHRARQALAAVDAAAAAGARRADLAREDATLDGRLVELEGVRVEAERAAAAREALSAELRRLCDVPGLEASDDPGVQVAAFRQAASTRRNLEAAAARLAEVRRRLQVLGPADEEALSAEQARLEADLVEVGGDPAALAVELPLEAGRLHALEVAAQRAHQEATAALTRVTGLRERLAGALDGVPVIADLEDERLACLAVRDRCHHQLAALAAAEERVQAAARQVHREIAPRLAAAVGHDLALITDGRYTEVDVDAQTLAVTLHSAERLELVPVDLLSRGSRDQVALLLRVALAGVLGEGGERAPLLLDDPLQTSDPGRRAALVETLVRLGERAQVLLTTTDPAVGDLVARAGEGHTALVMGRVGGAYARAATASRTAVTTPS